MLWIVELSKLLYFRVWWPAVCSDIHWSMRFLNLILFFWGSIFDLQNTYKNLQSYINTDIHYHYISSDALWSQHGVKWTSDMAAEPPRKR